MPPLLHSPLGARFVGQHPTVQFHTKAVRDSIVSLCQLIPSSTAEESGSMFLRLGRGVVRHPWLVIGIWIVAAAAIIGLAPTLATSSSESSFLPSHYQSVQAQNLQQSAFPAAAAPGAIVVFERADGGHLTAADSSLVDSVASKLAADDIPTMGTMQAGPPS